MGAAVLLQADESGDISHRPSANCRILIEIYFLNILVVRGVVFK